MDPGAYRQAASRPRRTSDVRVIAWSPFAALGLVPVLVAVAFTLVFPFATDVACTASDALCRVTVRRLASEPRAITVDMRDAVAVREGAVTGTGQKNPPPAIVVRGPTGERSTRADTGIGIDAVVSALQAFAGHPGVDLTASHRERLAMTFPVMLVLAGAAFALYLTPPLRLQAVTDELTTEIRISRWGREERRVSFPTSEGIGAEVTQTTIGFRERPLGTVRLRTSRGADDLLAEPITDFAALERLAGALDRFLR